MLHSITKSMSCRRIQQVLRIKIFVLDRLLDLSNDADQFYKSRHRKRTITYVIFYSVNNIFYCLLYIPLYIQTYFSKISKILHKSLLITRQIYSRCSAFNTTHYRTRGLQLPIPTLVSPSKHLFN